MKRINAFTLVELVAVIVVLALIAVIIVPTVSNSIKDSRQKAYDTQLQTIKNAAKDYILENIDLFENNTNNDIKYTITLENLKFFGLISNDIKNPLTGNYFSNESKVEVTIPSTSKEYTYNIILLDDEDRTNNDYNEIVSILNGSAVVYVELGDTYTDLKATIIDGSKKEIIEGNTNNVNTNKIGSYVVNYEYNGKIEATRTVIVHDTTKPTIAFATPTVYLLPDEVENYDLCEGVSITDNSFEGNATCNTSYVTSNLASIKGEYYALYSFTDNSGNKREKTRKFIVGADLSIIADGR